MPWSAGAFTRSNGTYSGASVWSNDATANINILSARHDTHDKDLADGINATLNLDGQNAMRANLAFGGFKGVGLATGTANTDAANVGQVVTTCTYDSGTRVLTLGRTVAGALTATLPLAAASVAGLVALPASSTGALYRDDGTFAAQSPAVLQFRTVNGAGTMTAGTAERATGAYTRTLPSTIAVNDQFVVHAQGGAVVISTPHTIKSGGTLVCSPGDTLTVEQGNTVFLVANSTSELGIV